MLRKYSKGDILTDHPVSDEKWTAQDEKEFQAELDDDED